MDTLRVAVTGSSGLLGHAVVTALRDDGHQVVRLVRRAPAAGDEITWDPRAPDGGLSAGELRGVQAVVHLAGAGIGDHRWTARYKAEVRDSRVLGTRALVTALARMSTPPAVLLSGSAIGWYGDTGGREVTESSPAGAGFLPGLVKDWEAAARAAEQAGTRVVTLRTSPVLSSRGGMLPRLLPLFRLGLGARLGTGEQVMSWLALPDYVRILRFLLAHPELSGPVNLSAPAPVTNAEFTATLAAALHRPALLTVPTPALRLMLGELSSDLLSSARVVPAKLLSAGYEFAYPSLAEALAAELG